MKKLTATIWTAAEVSKDVPILGIERFLLLDRLASLKPGSFEEAVRRRDMRDALLAEGTSVAWNWDELMSSGLSKDKTSSVFEVPLARTDAKAIRDFCKVAIEADNGGAHVFTFLDVYDRLNWMLSS